MAAKTKNGRQQIVLRLRTDVNRAVRAAARKSGQSINSYVESTFRRRLRIPKAA